MTTKKERREIGEGIVSYEARKGPGDVARENAWCLFLILAPAAALFSASESFRDWKFWIPSAFAALLALLNATAVCERLVLFRGLGVQFETASCLGARQRTFVEENKIEAVLINEAVTSTDAYYYLCFVMKSGDDMALAFPTSRPGVDFLAAAYNEAKALLEKKR
uniref:Phosphatidylinositol N-acetylglucosaminyltransferase subunit H conserved domain-containing protein n=1 Tax=Chloropicon roscoffensis TaxID=1461544 RepID=A0A7S3CCR7_9CHLO|mmetsp:Transcript_38/g.135  ORF Transcript_38/g.135 Transcript_38/m.135 type:complete len:165 (+) Transcript_38:186-680(+)